MSLQSITSRYAKSLLDLAIEQNKLDTVLADVQGFAKASENRDLYLMLKSPIVNTEKKLDVLKAIFDGKLDKLTMSFITLITKKGREIYLPEIATAFIEQYRDHKGISGVIITTAQALTDAELAKIKAKLVASDVTKTTLEIETKIDPSIIGGFVIEIGDNLYDASVAHKLDEIKKQFSGNDYAASI